MISFILDNVTYQAEEGMTWGEWLESEYSKDLPKTIPCLNCGSTLSLGFYYLSPHGNVLGYKGTYCLNAFFEYEDNSRLVSTDRVADGVIARMETYYCNG